MKNRTGEKRKMNNGQIAEIIEYRGWGDIDIKFEDGIIRNNVNYGKFKEGKIKNYYKPEVCNKGYLGEEGIKKKTSLKKEKAYRVWIDMLHRCYDNDYHKTHPSYINCEVCKEWHDYSNFKKWFDKNYYEIEGEKIELDKDILSKNNKINSPNTCVFIPNKINILITDSIKNAKGYVIHKRGKKKYQAVIRIDNKTISLGCFYTSEEAHNVYIKANKERISKTIISYKDKIPNNIYFKILDTLEYLGLIK